MKIKEIKLICKKVLLIFLDKTGWQTLLKKNENRRRSKRKD